MKAWGKEKEKARRGSRVEPAPRFGMRSETPERQVAQAAAAKRAATASQFTVFHQAAM